MDDRKLLALVRRCGVQGIQDRGTDIQGCCPYHEERRASWGISKREPHLFGCFACDARGSIVTLLIDKLGVSRTAAEQMAEVNVLPRRARDIFLEVEDAEKSDFQMRLAFDQFVPAKEAYRYLLTRGIQVATARKVQARYDFTLRRVLFPWFMQKKIVGFTGRALDPAETVKTLPYNNTKKGQYLYTPDPNFSAKDSKLVLVEGEIDSLKVWQDCRAVVAAVGFGKFTPEQQAIVISWSPREVVTFFDDDDTGFKLHGIVRKAIGNKVRVSYADYKPFREFYDPDDKLDPASLSLEHRIEILETNRNELTI